MSLCYQTLNQNVYEHGVSVKNYLFILIGFLEGKELSSDFRLPDWFLLYKDKLLNSLLSKDILEEYAIFHDCGKPYCKIIDNDGKQHFPNHAEVSYKTWIGLDGDPIVGSLIKDDMLVHTMKAADLDEFIKLPGAISLLITALAEVHSNATMFGGTGSTSFKIKYNQIDKRGKAICKKLFCI